jgi:peptide/nickel transport system ATP-binding protein
MPNSLLSIENLRTWFYTEAGVARAVDGVTFSIEAGETVGLVGESGCGKSVTALSILRLIASPGRIEPNSRMEFEGKDLVTLSDREMRHIRGNRIAMIFQEPMTALNPVFTVGDQIAEVARVHERASKKAAWSRAVEMLELVGIPAPADRAKEYPHQLSGGMRQRVMIAMALVMKPALVIADEPTTALDVTIQAQILELLRDLQTKFGTSILLITHDMGVVAETCSRVIVMYGGEIVEQAPVDRIFAKPHHPVHRGIARRDAEGRTGARAAEDDSRDGPAAHELAHRLSVSRPVPIRVGAHRAGASAALRGWPGAPLALPPGRRATTSRAAASAAGGHDMTAPATQAPLLSVRQLSKHYARKSGIFGREAGVVRAVDGVSFDVFPGETLGLVGESGCGKTTTGRAILRLIEPTAGEVRYEGNDVLALKSGELRALRRKMQIIFQDPSRR